MQTSNCNSGPLDMINKHAIESAHAFFHQKQRIYQYSALDWQKDDIEYAIEDYASQMDKELYAMLADGRDDYLRNHSTFAEDILNAIEQLDKML